MKRQDGSGRKVLDLLQLLKILSHALQCAFCLSKFSFKIVLCNSLYLLQISTEGNFYL